MRRMHGPIFRGVMGRVSITAFPSFNKNVLVLRHTVEDAVKRLALSTTYGLWQLLALPRKNVGASRNGLPVMQPIVWAGSIAGISRDACKATGQAPSLMWGYMTMYPSHHAPVGRTIPPRMNDESILARCG